MMSNNDNIEIIEEVVEQGSPAKWGCLLVFSPMVICGLALFGSVLFCGNTFGGIFGGIQNMFASIGNIFNFDLLPNSTTITSIPAIVERIKPLGQLVTTRVELATSRIEIATQYGIANVCNIGSLHSAQGFVEAGINLEGFTPENVIYDEVNNSYTLRLPAPTVTNCQLDPMEMIKYHDWGTSPICSADWDEMRRLASYEALIKFRDRAVDEGIIERAERQADLVVSNFVSSLTGATVNIEFVADDTVSYPRECMPQLPEPWIYNEDKKQWERGS